MTIFRWMLRVEGEGQMISPLAMSSMRAISGAANPEGVMTFVEAIRSSLNRWLGVGYTRLEDVLY